MNKFKISNEKWFWILQFLGWGSLGISQIVIKSVILESTSRGYLIIEGILIIVSGVLFTAVLRSVLRSKISIETIGVKSLVPIGVALLVTSILLAAFQEMVARFFYFLMIGEEIETNSFGNFANTFIVLFFWVILYFSIKSITRAQKGKVERLKLESTLKESQLNTLKGQINPHFMFNSLNNIRGLMLEDVHKSREMITKLSELLRYSLNSNKIDKISLKEELEIVNNYIELSKIQFEKRLEYHEELETGLLDIEIPPMLIQMLIENAIKHGISNQIKGGQVNLKVYKNNKNFIIEVSNTGNLIENKTSTKIGLRNISERLRLLYGAKASFTLKEEKEMVVAKIKITVHE